MKAQVMILAFILILGSLNAEKFWLTGQSMCPPFCSDRWAEIDKPSPNQLKLGEQICFSLNNAQYNKYWSWQKPPEMQIAIMVALGLPIFQDFGYRAGEVICHKLVWMNSTNFITQATNPSQKFRDDFNMTWKENYKGRVK
jgi:hypothetical protein